MLKIMFTGGGGAGNEAIWRLLQDRYELHFCDVSWDVFDPVIPDNRRHLLPWASDTDFQDTIAKLCEHLAIDLLVPGVDEELEKLIQIRDKLGQTRLLLPQSDYVITMLDKLAMIHVLRRHKIYVPDSRNLDDDLYGFNFPCIAKPRKGRGSRDVSVINTLADVDCIKLISNRENKNLFLQEKIDGIEYTVQMIANAEGYLCAIVPVKIDLKRGITIRAVIHNDINVINTCIKIHKFVNACGCYNIQLILTQDGVAVPFEINPRISTTLCMSIAAGIDPIKIFVENARPDNTFIPTSCIQLQRNWKNYLSKI